ncbi:hypothetical protein [Candidatus Magnetominusculus xianensis]|uniref:Uncharacterized protein n=1 Tax=Candidatus Magnetominusculus xianensis TaxID=1748249 RepID=A0ABR5SEF7_9BACT|nr:hypothetical protein [Candidatus Magnetominusculus xianensis]KWT82929.1 hypothetical protein ASN18_2290 [Candidatus Magnetominusculus xianensis]MBF0403008.1 hypothetical protein [Nitrospirota bacterium]
MSDADDRKKIAFDTLKKALESEAIPKIYFNNAVFFLNPGDISILMQRDGSSVAVINMSLPVAKTVAAHLGSIIAEVEEKTGSKIMTLDDSMTALGLK